LKVHYFALA